MQRTRLAVACAALAATGIVLLDRALDRMDAADTRAMTAAFGYTVIVLTGRKDFIGLTGDSCRLADAIQYVPLGGADKPQNQCTPYSDRPDSAVQPETGAAMSDKAEVADDE